MAAENRYQLLLDNLKKRVRDFTKKEKEGRDQLRRTVRKMRKLGDEYKVKVIRQVGVIQDKIQDVRLSSYAKAAIDLECRVLKSVEKNARALASAVAKIEKKIAKNQRESEKKRHNGKRAKD